MILPRIRRKPGPAPALRVFNAWFCRGHLPFLLLLPFLLTLLPPGASSFFLTPTTRCLSGTPSPFLDDINGSGTSFLAIATDRHGEIRGEGGRGRSGKRAWGRQDSVRRPLFKKPSQRRYVHGGRQCVGDVCEGRKEEKGGARWSAVRRAEVVGGRTQGGRRDDRNEWIDPIMMDWEEGSCL